MVLRFPQFGPIGVGNGREHRSRQGADHAEVEQILFDFLAGRFERLIGGDEGAHAQRPDGSAFVVGVNFDSGGFNGHALMGVAGQHVGDGFGQFTVEGEGDFEPIR